ncbi:MAG: hypothetical protein KC543_05520 [Myxococcales bacterium]|nr:hypothetical protein [Myxococcales bacterium]
MADPPVDPMRRGDRRFVVRLVALLVAAVVGGLWAWAAMGRAGAGSCAARTFQTVTGGDAGR